MIKPYKIGQIILPRLIKQNPWLRYLPVFRQYAPGGKYAPSTDDHTTDVGLAMRLRR
jgi:hypothetical protein